MSEKRYKLDVLMDMPKLLIDNNTNEKYNLLMVNDIEKIVGLLNEQQSTIKKLQDLCGESDGENARLRQEIKKLKEEKGYWKSKAMTLLMQVRRLTPRMTAKEVIEFGKELEDE